MLALLNQCPSTVTGIRNRALLTVLYRGGLRPAEALGLYPKDARLDLGTITILNGKGGRYRTIGIDAGASTELRRWLQLRDQLRVAAGTPMFCTRTGKRLSGSYLRGLVPRLAGQAGIDKRVHPHGLRHTHAAELAAEGLPVNLIQAQLGHASLATTDRYLRHIAPVQLIEAIQRRTWPEMSDWTRGRISGA
jgi:site-specific recombinase XerD